MALTPAQYEDLIRRRRNEQLTENGFGYDPASTAAIRDMLRDSDFDLTADPTITRMANTPGATFRPGEFDAFMEMARAAQAQQQQRDTINQFFGDPGRQAEIERQVAPVEQSAWLNLLDQIRGTSRQAAFQRAESGNIGGSVEASQEAKIAGGAARAGMGLADQFQGQRDSLSRALEAARVNEILRTYEIDPQLAAGLQQRVQGYGVQGDTNALLESLRQRETAMNNYQDDEVSRQLGNAINTGGNFYQQYNNNAQNQDYQNFLNQLQTRRRTQSQGQPQAVSQ